MTSSKTKTSTKKRISKKNQTLVDAFQGNNLPTLYADAKNENADSIPYDQHMKQLNSAVLKAKAESISSYEERIAFLRQDLLAAQNAYERECEIVLLFQKRQKRNRVIGGILFVIAAAVSIVYLTNFV